MSKKQPSSKSRERPYGYAVGMMMQMVRAIDEDDGGFLSTRLELLAPHWIVSDICGFAIEAIDDGDPESAREYLRAMCLPNELGAAIARVKHDRIALRALLTSTIGLSRRLSQREKAHHMKRSQRWIDTRSETLTNEMLALVSGTIRATAKRRARKVG